MSSMNNVKHGKGIIVPFNGVLPKNLNELSNLVNIHCRKHKIEINRGDAVRFYISDNDNNIPTRFDGEEFHRNYDAFMIKDSAGTLVNLSTVIDSEGALPEEFVCYEEKDYFTRDHWRIMMPRPDFDMSDEKKEDDDYDSDEEDYLLLMNTRYIIHLAINNAALKNIKKHNQYIYTYWHDCRGVHHYYVRHTSDIQLPGFEAIIKSACKEGYLSIEPDFDRKALSDVITNVNSVVHYPQI